MNPSFKFILVFLVSLEISCTTNLKANLLVIAFSLLYLLLTRLPLKKLVLLLLVPLIAAGTIFATLYWFSPVPHHYYALLLASRVYVYVLTIACLAHTTSATTFARSLEQNLHLPSKFAYGVLSALNFLPQMRASVKQIRVSGMMRGLYLSLWSPQLYFKAILSALRAADNLAQGMESHGFKEGQKRSHLVKIPLTSSDGLKLFLALFALNIVIFFIK